MRALPLAFVVGLSACSPPVMNTPIAEIPKLGSLEAVMDNQATVADPAFKKIGAESYTDADYAAFTNVSERIQATSLKIKDFSRGPEFDALAMKLNEHAKALGAAASAKDAKQSSAELQEMKATCKSCHSQFR